MPENHDADGRGAAAHTAAEIPIGAPATLAAGAADINDAVHAEPLERMSIGRLLPIFFTTFTLFIAYIAPTSFSLAVRIQQIDPLAKDAALALAIGIPGVLVVIITPLVGILSDRTLSRFGRRRPWMLAGGIVSLAGMFIVATVGTIPLIIVGWSIAYTGFAVSASMITAHFGDRLPESQRGKVMGINGALTNVSPILGFALAASFTSAPFAMFVVPGLIFFVGSIGFVVFAKDAQYRGTPPKFEIRSLVKGFYFNPRRYPNLGWVWLSRACVFVALSFLSLYTVYLLSARLGMSAAEVGALTASLGLVGVVGGISGAIGSGFLSDKFGTRKPFLVISALVLAVAMVMIATMSSLPMYIAANVLSSVAIGVYGAVDQAIALDAIPHEENQNGRYLAIFGLGSALPQAIGPFLAASILGVVGGEYGWVYAVGGLFAVLGAFAIIPITVGKRATLATTSLELR